MTRPASVALVFSLVFTRALHGQPLSEDAVRASVQEEGNEPNVSRPLVEPAERSLTRVEAPASSVFAQDLQRSIRRAAFQQRRQTNHAIPKGFLWTGVSLTGYGGFLFLLGAGYGPDHLDCPRGDCRLCATADCPKTQDTLFRGASLFVASGAAVLGLGAVIGAKRSPELAPRITVNRRGVALQQPVPVDRWWRHAFR